jgi:hypothetical protein
MRPAIAHTRHRSRADAFRRSRANTFEAAREARSSGMTGTVGG